MAKGITILDCIFYTYKLVKSFRIPGVSPFIDFKYGLSNSYGCELIIFKPSSGYFYPSRMIKYTINPYFTNLVVGRT
jgi:hypothetical protein